MKRYFVLLLLSACLVAPSLFAQGQFPTPDTVFAGVPANPCPTGHFAQNAVTGDVYACDSATTNWYLLAGGGGGGITGMGTAGYAAFWSAATVLNAGPGDIVALNPTTDATHGVIDLGGVSFIHAFGAQNTFVGIGSGNFTTTGNGNNTAVGFNTLQSLTSGAANVAFGESALPLHTSGDGNSGLGDSALLNDLTGVANTAIGAGTLYLQTSGANNTALGENAGSVNVTGSGNTILGANADVTGAAATNQTAIGAGAVATADNQMVLGNSAVTDVSPGVDGLVALGKTGATWASLNLTDSTSSTAGLITINGDPFAHIYPSGTVNTFLGEFAGNFTMNAISADNNTGLGNSALFGLTTGSFNTCVGSGCLQSTTTGTDNTVVGAQAGTTITTGTENTLVGSGAAVSAAGAVNQTVIGSTAATTANNQVAIGNTSVTTILVPALKLTGAATGKKVVCVDTTTGILYTSSTGVDCSN